MTQSPSDRFRAAAVSKLMALTDLYDQLEVSPAETGDRALYQRQSAAKAVLTHIALLLKLLHLDMPMTSSAGSDALDIDGYRAMVAALDEESEGG